MFSLSIAVTGMAQPWRLLFKTESAARAAQLILKNAELCTIVDDFGQTATIGDWAGYLLEDLEVSRHAAIALMLYNHNIQMDAQKKAQQTANGPAIFQPGMAGVPFRQ